MTRGQQVLRARLLSWLTTAERTACRSIPGHRGRTGWSRLPPFEPRQIPIARLVDFRGHVNSHAGNRFPSVTYVKNAMSAPAILQNCGMDG